VEYLAPTGIRSPDLPVRSDIRNISDQIRENINVTIICREGRRFGYLPSGRKRLPSHERIHEINLEKNKWNGNMGTEEYSTLTNLRFVFSFFHLSVQITFYFDTFLCLHAMQGDLIWLWIVTVCGDAITKIVNIQTVIIGSQYQISTQKKQNTGQQYVS
jgi:hypothetical protein